MDNGAMTRDERERYQIALDRHRADLLDYAADQLDGIGHTRTAQSKREKASYHRGVAQLLEDYRAGTISKRDFHVARREIRPPFGVYDADVMVDFAEPTPEELGISVGGAS